MAALIIRGEDRTLTFTFTQDDGTPYSLAGLTAVAVRFRLADGTVLIKTLASGTVAVLSPASGGQMSVTLTDINTGLLALGTRNPIEVILDVGSDRRIFNIKNAIIVQDPILP